MEGLRGPPFLILWFIRNSGLIHITMDAPPSTPSLVSSLSIVQAKRVVLLEEQKPHAERILRILTNPRYGYGYLDTSEMGCGKTYVLAFIAQAMMKRPLILCPTNVIPVWTAICEEYSLRPIAIIGFESLISTAGHQPKHGFLTRIDGPTVEFRPTMALVRVLEDSEAFGGNGIVLVVDEAQKCKNDSMTTSAVSCLTLSVSQYSPRSRFAFLSGSIYDNEDNAVNIMRAMGLVSEHRVGTTNVATGMFTGMGVNQAIAFAALIDEAGTRAILSRFDAQEKWRTTDAKKVCHALFVGVIKVAIGSAMPQLAIPHHIYDGFFSMNQNETDALNKALSNLKDVAEKNGEVKMGGKVLGDVMQAHMAVQASKVPIFYRLTKSILRMNPSAKVICALCYKDPIGALLKTFEEDPEFRTKGYKALVLVGDVEMKYRAQIIRLFNEDPQYNILVMSSQIGNLGNSFHDLVGNAPRWLLAAPTFDLIGSFQLTHRIIRAGTMSIPTVIFVYCNSAGEQEDHILQNLCPKGNVLRETMEEHMKSIPLPGSYPRYTESENGFMDDIHASIQTNGGKLLTQEPPSYIIPRAIKARG